MDWLDALRELRETRTPAVVVTLAAVRGHAPRDAGAKMVVALASVTGTIGGGNLEATATDRARALLRAGMAQPELLTMQLSDKATNDHGVQCCGGEVTIMLEPVPVRPSVAVFGIGHVGMELARILARHEVELHLVDSRIDMLGDARLEAVTVDAPGRVHVHHAPVPEAMLAELPPATHVLVMSHDHVEDLAIVDMALRTPDLASIGLIGSSAKWSRFRVKLADAGHDADALARVTTPIGMPEIHGKEPAVIAVSVAARLLILFEEALCS